MAGVVSCVYCSCACNKSPRALSWGHNGLICYGACHAINIFQFEQQSSGGKVIQTLIGHQDLVTSVHWVKHADGTPETELISTSADKTAIIWTEKKSQFLPAHYLVGHSFVVATASATYCDNDDHDLIIATASADSTVKIWRRYKDEVTCSQTISFGNRLPLDVCFSTLESPCVPILAVGGDDAKICIYTPNEAHQFIPAVFLEGHEDWIRSLDFIFDKEGDLLLSSASQDCFIRIWRISLKDNQEEMRKSDVLKVKEKIFQTVSGHEFCVTLESVLGGHEDWIYSARWSATLKDCNPYARPLQILSASMDKTMIIWEPDPVTNIWFEKVRVGEVGGNTLGFYGGVFSPDGQTILAHGYHGAIHMWNFSESLNTWQPDLAFGGHFSAVQDIDWDPEGEFVLSCSHDQTSRLHAPFVSKSQNNNWHEVARPQVHGYDMVCLSMINRYKFISSGDEKVIRVFQAPRSFAENLQNICKIDSSSYVKDLLPDGASVPSLGLSNKAVFQEDIIKAGESNEEQKHAKDQYPEFYYTPVELSAPPTEELLIQNTLWPEIQKLYGHPYEVFAVVANHSGTIVASACKASKPDHAAIILWDISSWKQLGHLVFHNLTVTQISFSPNDEYLLSVSRDRMWALYKHFPNETPPYKKVLHLDKKKGIHSRIIWSCAWSHDSMHFATASRDKKVAIWSKEFTSCSSTDTEDSATAVAFAPCLMQNKRYLLAIGMENGKIIIGTWHDAQENAWMQSLVLDKNIAHHLNVNRLKFSPILGEAGCQEKDPNIMQLASCSCDYHTKIYNLFIDTFS